MMLRGLLRRGPPTIEGGLFKLSSKYFLFLISDFDIISLVASPFFLFLQLAYYINDYFELKYYARRVEKRAKELQAQHLTNE